MNLAKTILFAAAISALSFLGTSDASATGGDHYASFWKCSDGNTYGLVADGNRRALYLPSCHAPLFFSGVKEGCYYYGTIYQNGYRIPVSGPISNHSTRVTLRSQCGRWWVLDFSHR